MTGPGAHAGRGTRRPRANSGRSGGGRARWSALLVSASFALACGSALAAPAATTPAVIGAPAPAPPAMLGGVLPVSQRLDRRWPWAGTWLFPVGDTLALGAEGPGGPPAYHATRGVSLGEEGGSVHFGADLSNRVGGGIVRAAAHGVVLCVERVSRGDYGLHIVIAHRMEDGSLAYSVYAHLRPKSLRVKPGDIVSAGQPIARVGRSGRASTEHLHFEVRRPSDADERWEKTTPVDPVAFVASRLPDPDRDPTWAGGYLSWAEGAAIVPRG